MRVFISWSKEPSRTVAAALHGWLPDVIQTLKPWMSSADIRAGARWSVDVADQLASAKIGILCVTADNQAEPWLLFEAGALAKTLEGTFVCPYLVQMPGEALAPGPLTQFQAKHADKEGTFALLKTINAALDAEGLSPERLERAFELSWPALETRLASLPTARESIERPHGEMLGEILTIVRSLARQTARPGILDRAFERARSADSLGEFNRRRAVLRASGEVVGDLEGDPDRAPATDLRSYTEMLRQLSTAVELVDADVWRHWKGPSRSRRLAEGGGDKPPLSEEQGQPGKE